MAEELSRQGKGPIADAFAVCVEALVVDGRLRCSAAHLAARPFKGPGQEFLVWPSVMACEEETADQPSVDVVIEEAVRTVLAC